MLLILYLVLHASKRVENDLGVRQNMRNHWM